MNLLKYAISLAVAMALVACGGGGGNPGTASGAPLPAASAPVAAPSMTLFVYNSLGAKVYSVSSDAVFTARATVLDAVGAPVANKLVTFSNTGFSNLTVSPTTSVTNASGIAEITVAPSANSTGGGVSMSASATVGSTAVTAQVDFAVSANSSSTTASVVTDFVLLLSKNTINNSGTDQAQLSVVTVDAKRNIVPGASVVVTSDQNSIFTPGSNAVTDASGTYTGTLTIGSDKSDRDVTLSVTVNGITKRTIVRVAGSRLSIQALPSAPAPSQSVTVTATLVDSTGSPIPNVDVTLDGTVPGLQNQKLTTDLNGIVSRVVTAPAASGSYTLSASGSGVSAANYQLNVFSSLVPDAVIPVGATPSLSASPNVLAINSSGTSANKSTLRFLFLDSTNSPVKNVRVRFDDITTGLALVGASISSAATTLYTDDSGVVLVQYISGQNSSPTNGITVRACYSASDFAAPACPNSVNVNLTTVGQALAISIGDDNILTTGAGTYIKNFTVTVADSAGRAVANAPVAISVDLTHYGKGYFASPYYASDGVTVLTDLGLTVVPSSLTTDYPALTTTDPATKPQRVWCQNEDTNRNGNVDPGENVNGSVDSNGQPTLEPRKSDLIVSYADPAVTVTNASGVLVIKVEYSQRFATWLAYRVIATTSVSGSQGMAERLFVTGFLDADAKNGSFLTPPYGVGSCLSPN